MSFWRRLLKIFRPERSSSTLTFELEQELVHSLQILAARQECSKEEMAADLLSMALAQQDTGEETWQCWNALTPREQEVVALVCLGYTTREIATRLVISSETVKSHIRHTLVKFRLSRRSELRRVLVDWDFSAWDRDP